MDILGAMLKPLAWIVFFLLTYPVYRLVALSTRSTKGATSGVAELEFPLELVPGLTFRSVVDASSFIVSFLVLTLALALSVCSLPFDQRSFLFAGLFYSLGAISPIALTVLRSLVARVAVQAGDKHVLEESQFNIDTSTIDSLSIDCGDIAAVSPDANFLAEDTSMEYWDGIEYCSTEGLSSLYDVAKHVAAQQVPIDPSSEYSRMRQEITHFRLVILENNIGDYL